VNRRKVKRRKRRKRGLSGRRGAATAKIFDACGESL